MNKLQEKFVFEMFKRRYHLFPEGEITHPDKPDFIINSDRKIGVEVTQIFKDQHLNKGSVLRTKQTFKEQLLTNIVSELKSTDFPKCVVAVDLNDRNFTRKENTKEIARQCFSEIYGRKNHLKKETHYEFNNNGGLPSIIRSYSLFVSDGFQETEFVLTGSSIGHPLTNDYIQFILDKKESAKKQYENCDENWLVIFEGSFEADHFGKITADEKALTTTFDKVFLLRQFGTDIVVVK